MKRILYVLHCYYNRAGTEEHTRALAAGLRSEFETYIVAPHGNRLVLFAGDREVLALPIPAVPWPVTPYRLPAFEVAMSRILQQVNPDIIHLQHFFNYPLSLMELLARTGMPLVMSFHDYYALTPHFTMEGAGSARAALTREYSEQTFGADLTAYLTERRTAVGQGIERAAVRIVPSEYLASVMQEVFPGPYRVIEHGIAPFSAERRAVHGELPVLGYVGSLLPQKGFAHCGPVLRRLRERFPRLSMEVFGGGPLSHLPQPEGTHMHGAYHPADLPRIMSAIDIGIIPSIFAETFSLVLSEFRQVGIPVIASRIGAFQERIRDGIDGALFRPGDEDDMYRVLAACIESDSWKTWNVPKPRLLEEMLKDYAMLYAELLQAGQKLP